MRLTQFDIARLSKASQATVSRVLSGNEGVEPEVRERILRVVKEHNYQPDARARSLRTRKTRLIGLVLKRPHGGLADDPFFAALTSGIIDYLCGHPYHLCVDLVTDEATQHSVYDEMLRTRRVDGLILVEPEVKDERIVRLNEDAFPFVIIGNPKTFQVPSVDNDNVHAGRMATGHLYEQGYQDIAFLAGAEGLTVSDDRIEGYLQSVARYGGTPRVLHTEFGFDSGREAARKLLSSPHPPDAIVVLDDFMAFGTVLAARSLGVSIPDELGLVSFNDSSLCQLVDGGLTSVSLNMRQLVDAAVSRLLASLEGESESGITEIAAGKVANGSSLLREIIPCELKIRGSSQKLGPI